MSHGALAEGGRQDCRPSRPVTVLVADDNDYFRSGLVRALGRRADLQLVAAVADGAEALRAIREHRPDVALVDARMPLLDGLSLAAAVSSDPNLAGTRVVLLSARADAAIAQQALAAGAVAFVDKTQSRRRICDVVADVAVRRPSA